MHPPSRQSCAFCGAPLTPHQAASGATCGQHACNHQAALQAIAQRKAQAHARLMASAARHRDRAAAKLKLASPHEIPIALVPASTRRLTLLPASRRRLFREHLEMILTRLEQTPAASRAPLPPEERADAAPFHPEAPVFGAGCSACRGYCCRTGGVKAFLNEQTLQRFAASNPSLDRSETVHAYVSRLPERSMKDSCVFHGEQGCTLPRNMRAAICNTYHCDSLLKLQAVNARQVLITAADDGNVVRAAVFTDDRIITAHLQTGADAQSRLPVRGAASKASRADR